MITNNLTVKWCFPYALFAIARDAVYVFVISFYFLYLSRVLCLPLSFIIPMMIGIKVLDILKEPFIGTLIDCLSTKYNFDKYKVCILVGSFVNAIFVYLMFNIPNTSVGLKELLATLTLLGWMLSFSFYDLTSWSLISTFNASNLSREIASAIARACATLGFIVGLVLSTHYFSPNLDIINNLTVAAQKLFFYCAICLTIILTISAVAFSSSFTNNYKAPKNINFKRTLKSFFNNDQLMIVFVLSLFQQICFNTFVSEYDIFLQNITDFDVKNTPYWVLQAPWVLGMFLTYFAFSFLTKLSSRRIVYVASIALPAIASVVLYVLVITQSLTFLAYNILVALCGIGLSLSLVSTTVMTSDCVDYSEFKFGLRADCTTFSIQTISAKLGALFIVLISGISFSLSGTDLYDVPYEGSENYLAFCTVIIFVGSICASAIYFIYYKLHGSFFENILNNISNFTYDTENNNPRKKQNSVRYAIDEKCVIHDLPSNDLKEIINILTERLHNVRAINSKTDFLESLHNKMSLTPPGIAHGIAIPHTRGDFVNRSSLAIATLKNPIDCGSLDEKPCDLIFLIATPDDGKSHMNLLKNLSLMLSEPGFANKLRNAGSAEEITKRLIACEKNLFSYS